MFIAVELIEDGLGEAVGPFSTIDDAEGWFKAKGEDWGEAVGSTHAQKVWMNLLTGEEFWAILPVNNPKEGA